MKILNKKELYEILYGCTILGTGGGGELKPALKLMDKTLEEGKEFQLVNFDQVPDDALIATPYMCGSISPQTEEQKRKYEDLPRIKDKPPLRAFKTLQKYLGEDIYGIISTELGGGNTAQAFHVAAMAGIKIIDADPAGRSVPELQHTTYFVNDLGIAPMAVANEFGDAAIITDVVDDFRAEEIVRSMAIVSNNSIGVADHLATARRLREAVIPGAISYAQKIGEAYMKAREEGEDVALKVAEAGEGLLLFKGEVSDFSWEDKEGFTYGEAYLKGQGDFSGSSYKIWFKNENIITWKDGKIDVTVPDLVCVLDRNSKEPVTNPYYERGMELSVIGLPSPEEWKTKRGLEVFGPKHFGYDIEYKPLEERMK